MSIVITKYLVITIWNVSYITYRMKILKKSEITEIRGKNMSIDYSVIGKRIQEIRKKCGLTQERLAEKLNVSVGYISQLERGITRVNLDTLSNISSELDCDIIYFLTDVTINDKNFLNDELAKIFNDMNSSQRKMLLEIAEIIKKRTAY